MNESGFSYYNAYSDLTNDSGRFFACFSDVVTENSANAKPTLSQIASFAVDYMEENYPDGYFLMIEGAKIDKRSHNGSGRNITEMMKEVVEFSNAIEAVEERISGKYALIVTADHETGGLQKAENKSELTNSLYSANDHTDAYVPLYFKAILNQTPSILKKDVILNTEVFSLCKSLLAI